MIKGHKLWKVEWTQETPHAREHWVSFVSSTTPVPQEVWEEWQGHFVQGVTEYSCTEEMEIGEEKCRCRLLTLEYKCSHCEQYWAHTTWKRFESRCCPDCKLPLGG